MPINARGITGLALSEIAGIGALALLLYYLPLSGALQASDPWAVDRVVVYLLLFTGPLFIFLPLTVTLRLGPLWLLGAGSWALVGYVLLFIGAPGRDQAGFITYVAFLALLFVALGSALAVPLGALSGRLLPSTSYAGNLVRAYREGALLSLFIVTLMGMSPLGVLNWLNALLVFTVVALTEFFFLARD